MSSPATEAIPVVLFAYARPAHLARALECLRANAVPRLYAFADAAKNATDVAAVEATRAMLRAIDWCDVQLVEREKNLGLGRNVLAGVEEVAAKHEAFVVWEDDLICVPGTYAWMCAALLHYRDDARVMSVSGWTHPRVTPGDVGEAPYFDARADCWVWGAWARAWQGVTRETALEKMKAAARRGVAPAAYGADLPEQAGYEQRRNVWAVRWLYHHFQHGGLCVRPPWSMVEHIGFDALATNAANSSEWANPPLRPAPPIPTAWPVACEHPSCRMLWQTANPRPSLGQRVRRKIFHLARTVPKRLLPDALKQRLRARFGWRWFRGEYQTWAEARAASSGYDDGAIVQKVLAATLEVKAGHAAFERDGVLFPTPEVDRPLLTRLQEISRTRQARLSVLDFGGSLGASYWRHRAHLPTGDKLLWDIVEQPGFIAAGQQHLADTPLRFFPDVTSAEKHGTHDVLLCSCVLQYLENPFAELHEWSRHPIPFVLLNNLPLHAEPDRLTVQHVPPSIYPASYPVWFFNRAAFLHRVAADYEVMEEFESEAQWPWRGSLFQSTGLLLKRKGTT